MNTETLQTAFDNISKNYDEQRKRLIPCLNDFYGLPITAIDLDLPNPQVLDIGAGTGLFSAFLLKRFPDARLTLIDISEKMLEVARQRFKNNLNAKFIVANYSEYNFDVKFDIILSALSIHHLDDREKENLYKKIYSMLKPGGIFINSDQVSGDTSLLDSMYKNLWKDYVNKSGLNKEEIAEAFPMCQNRFVNAI
jgi:tRNA (cmo5U34)-methyltransferase